MEVIMAFTRKFLISLGIDEDKIDTIITAHTEVTDALKQERDQYKTDAEKLPEVQRQLKELKDDGYKDKYEQEHQAFEDYKKEQDAKAQEQAKADAYKAILKEIGVADKRIDKVLKVSKDVVNGIEFDSDGNVKGAEDLKKAAEDEWAEFIVKSEEHGANPATPPQGSGTGMSKKDILNIKDTKERQQAIADNIELFE